ncbi:MAG: hypothetical protein ACRDE2_11990 [Chitinophagaceae bacterium]
MWYEIRSEGLGIRFRNAVNATIEKIKINPEAFARKKQALGKFLLVVSRLKSFILSLSKKG